MPPGGEPLSTDQVAFLRRWIDGERTGPLTPTPILLRSPARSATKTGSSGPFSRSERRNLPPSGTATGRAATLIAFSCRDSRRKGLTPAPDADRLTLLRRIRYDLTGLPPTPAEIEAFLRDDSPDVYERIVDRLLASPEFGERWGRHWLDVTYWADTTGVGRRTPLLDAWRYRDYVIESFNADRPVSQFHPRTDRRRSAARDDARSSASGSRPRPVSWSLGPWDFSGIDKLQMQMDMVDLQIDMVAAFVLGQSSVAPGATITNSTPFPHATTTRSPAFSAARRILRETQRRLGPASPGRIRIPLGKGRARRRTRSLGGAGRRSCQPPEIGPRTTGSMRQD